MPEVIVMNIPEYLTAEAIVALFEKINVQCNNGKVKIVKASRPKRDGSTERYCILSFETEATALLAVNLINNCAFAVGETQFLLQASLFVQNFKQSWQDPERNIIIFNLPSELKNVDLVDIFSYFGRVLSARIESKGEGKPGIGYVLFERKCDAQAALSQANGKYLRENKITVQPFRSLEDRLEHNREVILLSAGPSSQFPPDLARNYLQHLCPNLQFAPSTEVCIKDDARCDEHNSGGAAWIFTAESHEIADEFIQRINEMGFQFAGVKEPCKATFKLPRGVLARSKAEKSNQNREKYAASGASVQVFNLRADVDREAVKCFFSRYGQIEQVTGPGNGVAPHPMLFHLNILYQCAQQADKAIAKAAAAETKLQERLAENGKSLRVVKYRQKSNDQQVEQTG